MASSDDIPSDDILMETESEQIHRRRESRREDLSNTDQVSLINTVIDKAFDRQKKALIAHIDSKLGGAPKPTTVVDDFEFSQEGNKIQFKFNSQRAEKLSDILRLIQSDHFDEAEDVIKSELGEFKERNKHLKIADRHGWDTVREYTLHPLADDNEDAAKLRTAIARASRKRTAPKPYDRRRASATNQGYSGFVNPQPPLFRPRFPAKDTTANIFAPGSCFTCHLPGHFAKHCPYTNRQFIPRIPAPAATATKSATNTQQGQQ